MNTLEISDLSNFVTVAQLCEEYPAFKKENIQTLVNSISEGDKLGFSSCVRFYCGEDCVISKTDFAIWVDKRRCKILPRQDQPQLKRQGSLSIFDEKIEVLKLDTRINNYIKYPIQEKTYGKPWEKSGREKAEIIEKQESMKYYVGDIVQLYDHDVLYACNLSKVSLRRLKEALDKHGLTTGMHIEWTRPSE